MKVASADARQKTKPVGDPKDAVRVRDASDVLLRDQRWKRVYLGIGYALAYFGVFLAALFSHIPATDSMYKLGYSVSSTLAASGADTITADSSMKFTNIQTIGDTFEWLTDTFVPGVFVTTDYNGNALERDKWGRVAMFNKVLGGVVFNTTRASIHPCETEQYLLDLYPNCYDPGNTTVDSVVIGFDTNASEASAIINQLKERGDWLDFATQELQITVVTYNGEVEAYTVTDLIVTFHQGGFVEPSSSTTPALSDPYKGAHTVVLDVLVAILWLGNVVLLMPKLWTMVKSFLTTKQPSTQRTRVLSLSDKMNFLVSYFGVMMVGAFYGTLYSIVAEMKSDVFRSNLAHLVGTGKAFDANSEERKGLLAVTDSLKNIARLTVFLRSVAIFTVLLMGSTVLKAFHAHPSLSVLTRTIARALHRFGSVFVVFVVVFVTFSASGTVLFGDRVASFSSFSKSLETCINMLFGNFDYAAIQDMYIPAPMLFYWAYMIIVSLILLNMMLAIVLDAYTSVGSESDDVLQSTSVTQVMIGVCWDVVEGLTDLKNCKRIPGICRRRHQAAWTEKLAQCRELPADEVVTLGHIRPSALLFLLSSLLGSLVETPAGDSKTKLPPDSCETLTVANLQFWFARAEISKEVAQRTIRFIQLGMVQDEVSSVEKSEENQNKPSATNKNLDSGEIGDGGVAVEASTASAGVAPVPSADAAADLRAATLMKQVEEMQRKLDLLLSKSAMENETKPDRSVD